VHSVKIKKIKEPIKNICDSVAKPIIQGISIGDKVSKAFVRKILMLRNGDSTKGETLVTKKKMMSRLECDFTMSSVFLLTEGGRPAVCYYC
jgi:hypothetical protein